MDETFFKAKYHGTLLTACGMDVEEKVFPLAFVVIKYENIS